MMKKVFLRVLLGLLQAAYLIFNHLKDTLRKVRNFVYDIPSIIFGGQEAYAKMMISRLPKQPKHLILSFYEDISTSSLRDLSKIILLLASTKTNIITLYDTNGNLSKNTPTFLANLQNLIGAKNPNNQIFLLSKNNSSSEVIYHIDSNKREIKEFTLSSIDNNIMEGKGTPLIINILNPLDNFADFLKNSKAKDVKLGKVKSDLICNRPLKVLEKLGVKMSANEYDTSLMVNFCKNIDCCLGVSFDLLSNAEILFERKFRDFDYGSLLRVYKKFSTTKQRRGK